MFKNLFRKCTNLDIPKQAQVYLFYYRLSPEFCNMEVTSADGSVMKMEIDDAYQLYERIVECQANWLTERDFPKKAAGIYNIDIVTTLAEQMEVIMNSLTTYPSLLTWYIDQNQFTHVVG